MNRHLSVGGLIGCGALVIVMWESSPLVVVLAAVAGFGFGSFIGMLLWLSCSAELPEQRVVPPFAGDECASHDGCRTCPKQQRCVACRAHVTADRRIAGERTTLRRRKAWHVSPTASPGRGTPLLR